MMPRAAMPFLSMRFSPLDADFLFASHGDISCRHFRYIFSDFIRFAPLLDTAAVCHFIITIALLSRMPDAARFHYRH